MPRSSLSSLTSPTPSPVEYLADLFIKKLESGIAQIKTTRHADPGYVEGSWTSTLVYGTPLVNRNNNYYELLSILSNDEHFNAFPELFKGDKNLIHYVITVLAHYVMKKLINPLYEINFNEIIADKYNEMPLSPSQTRIKNYHLPKYSAEEISVIRQKLTASKLSFDKKKDAKKITQVLIAAIHDIFRVMPFLDLVQKAIINYAERPEAASLFNKVTSPVEPAAAAVPEVPHSLAAARSFTMFAPTTAAIPEEIDAAKEVAQELIKLREELEKLKEKRIINELEKAIDKIDAEAEREKAEELAINELEKAIDKIDAEAEREKAEELVINELEERINKIEAEMEEEVSSVSGNRPK